MTTPRPLRFEIDERGCFNVVSHSRTGGYPQRNRRVGGKVIGERWHRIVYEECFGVIPPGMKVRHGCDNPACINPEHLNIGTQADNMRDASVRGRWPQARATLEQARQLRRGSLSDALRAGQGWGFSSGYVRAVRAGVNFLHLDVPPVPLSGTRAPDEFRRLRLQAGLTLKQVGAHIGRSAAAVSRLERRDNPIAYDLECRLLAFFAAVQFKF